MELRDFLTLVEAVRSQGAVRVKAGDIEVEFGLPYSEQLEEGISDLQAAKEAEARYQQFLSEQYGSAV